MLLTLSYFIWQLHTFLNTFTLLCIGFFINIASWKKEAIAHLETTDILFLIPCYSSKVVLSQFLRNEESVFSLLCLFKYCSQLRHVTNYFISLTALFSLQVIIFFICLVLYRQQSHILPHLSHRIAQSFSIRSSTWNNLLVLFFSPWRYHIYIYIYTTLILLFQHEWVVL